MEIKKITLLNPSKDNNFSKIDKDIPRYAGVYLLFDKDLKLIYIGQSDNIRRRVLQHCSDNSRRLSENDNFYVTKLNFNDAQYYSYVPLEKETDRKMYESILINLFEPKYN